MDEHHHHEAMKKHLSQDRNVLLIALLITSSVMVAELIGGLFSNSLALVSDAGHMLTDTLALAFSFFAVLFIVGQSATPKKTYGFYRLEILAALFNGALLVLLALFLFFRAYGRFLQPEPINSGLLLAIASVGLLANIAAVIFLFKSSQRGLNVRAAFWHVVSDALSSVGVVAAGIIIYFTQWYIVDPAISVIIGVFILRGAAVLVSESADILLEATPKEINLDEVVNAVKKIDGVRDFHDVHIWTITSGFYALSGHLLVEDSLVSEANDIMEQVNHFLLDRYKIQHATIQLECEACDTGMVCKIK